MQPSEPRNPFYFLLLLASLLFVATALAYAVVPVLEEKAARSGPLPPSVFRDSLRAKGGTWLFGEVGAIGFFAVCSMGLDRLRSLKKEHTAATIPPPGSDSPPQ
jgi:hypothetical protein